MPIPYDPEMPLEVQCWTHRLPATLADCIDQFRLDIILKTLETDDFDPALLHLFNGDHVADATNFNQRFDPLISMGDNTLAGIPPGEIALLPPLPLSLIGEFPEKQPEMTLYAAQFAKRFSALSDCVVLSIGRVAAASLCDESPAIESRDEAIVYMAVNNGNSPVARFLAEHPTSWHHRRRRLALPDMRKVRKNDFVALFEQHGQPLSPHELECVSDSIMLGFVHDLRTYVLERNRHIAICGACAGKLDYYSRVVMSQPTTPEWIM